MVNRGEEKNAYFTRFHNKKTIFGLLQRQIEHKGTQLKHLYIIVMKREEFDVLVHHGLPTMISHDIASSAYHPRGRDVFLLYLSLIVKFAQSVS